VWPCRARPIRTCRFRSRPPRWMAAQTSVAPQKPPVAERLRPTVGLSWSNERIAPFLHMRCPGLQRCTATIPPVVSDLSSYRLQDGIRRGPELCRSVPRTTMTLGDRDRFAPFSDAQDRPRTQMTMTVVASSVEDLSASRIVHGNRRRPFSDCLILPTDWAIPNLRVSRTTP